MRASIEESVFSQTITEEITSVDEDGTVEEAEESKQGGLMDESEESDDGMGGMPEKQKRLQAPFFRQVFDTTASWQRRQTQVIMKQIGLKAN